MILHSKLVMSFSSYRCGALEPFQLKAASEPVTLGYTFVIKCQFFLFFTVASDLSVSYRYNLCYLANTNVNSRCLLVPPSQSCLPGLSKHGLFHFLFPSAPFCLHRVLRLPPG